MVSKAERLRRRRSEAARSAKSVSSAPHTPEMASRRSEAPSSAPTAQRMKKGVWERSTDTKSAPYVDRASDMIGFLEVLHKITPEQAEAARMFQELQMQERAQNPHLTGFKSCLADSVPGYDDGDGDASLTQRYRAAQARMTRPQLVAVMLLVDDQMPNNIDALRGGLDALRK